MNMMWDRKKAMQTIMQKRKAGGGPLEMSAEMKPEIVKDEDGEMDGRHMAAQDIMGAMHEKSADKLMQALANFMDLHNSQPEKPDPREG